MLLSPEEDGKHCRWEAGIWFCWFRSRSPLSQATAIMVMNANRLTNKSKPSKNDDVENSVRYFPIVIFMGNLRYFYMGNL